MTMILWFKSSKRNLPQPNESDIEFREPAKTVAAISFGGWANDEKINFITNNNLLQHSIAKG
jgi:hypothetical protein